MGSGRNRSEGWKHGKLSGHQNEVKILDALAADGEIEKLGARHLDLAQSGNAVAEGITQANVPCILGGLTPPKPDLIIDWDDGSRTGYSIKKSDGGQASLVTTQRFLAGYEAHYEPIPAPVQEACQLFFGTHPNSAALLAGTEPVSDRVRAYEIRKNHRMVWSTLKDYDRSLADGLLQWFRSSISNIADFCLSRGLASSPSDWADLIWYRNLVDDAEEDLDLVIPIDAIAQASAENSSSVVPGTNLGGSTIQLPFGSLQWHLGQMQFRHDRHRIASLVRSV